MVDVVSGSQEGQGRVDWSRGPVNIHLTSIRSKSSPTWEG
jgi:hypothetical protein